MGLFAETVPGAIGPGLWVLLGVLVGGFAALVLRTEGGSAARDVGVGVAGAALGGALASLIAPGFWGSIMSAFVGASALIAAMRELTPAPPSALTHGAELVPS